MAKPVEITNRQGKTQLVTPGRKYPFTKPDGTVGYIVYDDKGGGQFTADPSAPKPKPKPMPPVSITNRQGETQLVTPGRGYPFTKPDGTRGYIVYDDKGGAQFTAYPTQPKTPEPKTPAPAEPEKPAEPKTPEPRPKPVPVKSTRQQELDKINADKTLSPEEKWEIANPGLAAARRERKAIRGTSETDNPLMTGLRDAMPSPSTALDPKAFKADLAKSKIKPSAYSSLLDNPRRMKFTDSYDLVLDYLLSEGHADTVDEAHYVMMQLDSEYIRSIVESPGEWFRGRLNPDNSVAAQAQRRSPFTQPTKPLPSIPSPFAKPASRDDSGKLTTYGAGGGAEAERRGKTREQVMKQGAENLENKKRTQPVNQGPDFGR